MIMHNKTVVVDFDDTLSFTMNRDFENARCDKEVVNQLMHLKKLGWFIVIQTARGQLSCNGDYLAADAKYRSQIEHWLNIHRVPYDELTFNKRLAQLYIDDKSMHPDVFKHTVFEEHNGMSGAYILRIGDTIHKTSLSVHDEVTWYNLAKGKCTTPTVLRVVGNTLTMEYVQKQGCLDVNELLGIISNFAHNKLEVNWEHYIDRLRTHAKLISKEVENFVDKAVLFTTEAENQGSFCHGDLSLDNIISTEKGPVLIDPILMTDYSSWLLDLSKLIHSAQRYGLPIVDDLRSFAFEKGVSGQFLDMLVWSQWLRIVKYSTDELKYKALDYVNEYY